MVVGPKYDHILFICWFRQVFVREMKGPKHHYPTFFFRPFFFSFFSGFFFALVLVSFHQWVFYTHQFGKRGGKRERGEREWEINTESVCVFMCLESFVRIFLSSLIKLMGPTFWQRVIAFHWVCTLGKHHANEKSTDPLKKRWIGNKKNDFKQNHLELFPERNANNKTGPTN